MSTIGAFRSEDDVVNELRSLCASPGFAHVIANIIAQDHYVLIGERASAEDLYSTYSWDRLIRTEISTLIGFMVQGDLDSALVWPAAEDLSSMQRRTYALMDELHKSLANPSGEFVGARSSNWSDPDLFSKGKYLREPIFYAGEGAYRFQYLELSMLKYASDNVWLQANKGFSIHEAAKVVAAISTALETSALEHANRSRFSDRKWRTSLPAFVFKATDIVSRTSLSRSTIDSVLAAFTLPFETTNSTFQSIGDYNITNSQPLVRLDGERYLLFHPYSLAESLYESPTYWMLSDAGYSDTSTQHRGAFTEAFCATRLRLVFGENRVHENVKILSPRGKVLGEIDVLVLFADRAVIVQAKSKKLTIEARKGNDNQLRRDFGHAVQSAYNQAFDCARLIRDRNLQLHTPNGRVSLYVEPKEVYLLCVVAEHYPSLSFQVRQFLKTKTDARLLPPFVLDVFTLDVLTEMLTTPLYFLSYINRRAKYDDRVYAASEFAILSYHLRKNLWLGKEFDAIHIDDSVAADLDLAMISRRDGIPGAKTPDGILTRLQNCEVGRLIRQIENAEHPVAVDLGFMLLTLGENTLLKLGEGVDAITRLSREDKQSHDVTFGIGDASTGICIHSNLDSESTARARLLSHCELRKYSQHAREWFGACIDPYDSSIRFAVSLKFPWVLSNKMEARMSAMPVARNSLDLFLNSSANKNPQ